MKRGGIIKTKITGEGGNDQDFAQQCLVTDRALCGTDRANDAVTVSSMILVFHRTRGHYSVLYS